MSGYFWAGFGAVIGSCVVTIMAMIFSDYLWNFLDRYLIRVKLRMICVIGESNRWILYEATNAHAKPVTLSSFGLSFKGKKMGDT